MLGDAIIAPAVGMLAFMPAIVLISKLVRAHARIHAYTERFGASETEKDRERGNGGDRGDRLRARDMKQGEREREGGVRACVREMEGGREQRQRQRQRQRGQGEGSSGR